MILKSGILNWEETDQVGIIKISSGDPSNKIWDPAFCDLDTIREWTLQEHIRGIVVAGENRHFSSGADLSYFQNKVLDCEQLFHQFILPEAILEFIENLEKPVVAAIDGACLGAGLEISLACHMRFCNQGAILGFPEINHCIIPGLGGILRLVRIMGRAKAMEILLAGDTFGAEKALALGIVNGVIDDQSSFSSVVEFTKKIVNRGVKPVTYAIRSINNAGKMDFKEAAAAELRMFTELVCDKYK